MSTAQIIAPTPMAGSATTPRKGLASIRTIFNTNALIRHSITPLPSSTSPKRSNSGVAFINGSILGTPSSSVSVLSLFPGSSPKRSSMERAAERDWAEQAKQVYQLSTVNAQGAFLPPTPLERGYREYLVDDDKDYFETIINTPPERVRTFLSTESTISPGMFSTLPSSKIKRQSMPSFSSLPTPPSSTSATSNKSTLASNQRHHKSKSISSEGTSNSKITNVRAHSKENSPSFTEVDITAPSSPTLADSLMPPPYSPPAVPAKDIAYFPVSPQSTPKPLPRSRPQPQPQLQYQPPQEKPQPRQQQPQPQSSQLNRATEAKRRSRAQLSFLTGAPSEDEDLNQTLIDPFLLSSSPPDLITDSEGGEQSDASSSAASSPNASPRYSTVSSSFENEQIRRLNAQKLRAQNDFGSDLPIAR